MPRKSIEKKVFAIKDPSIKSYFGGNGTATTEYMKKIKSDINSKEFRDANDDKVVKWIDTEFDNITSSEDAIKKIGMDTNGPGTKKSVDGTNSNHFKNRDKENDNDNADPTRVRMAKIKGGSREIMNNSATYESIDLEIGDMMYLIEYMNNNKKIK
jgi:hypothetical protein